MICAVVLVTMAAFDLNTFVCNPTLSQFDKCKKSDLFEIAVHYNILVPAYLAKAELRGVLLDGLIGKGIFSLPASVSRSSQVGEGATAGEGLFDPQVSELPEVTSPPVGETPVVQHDVTAQKLLTEPHFIPLSVESSPGSKLDALLKVRLARLQLEKEEWEQEFQLRREMELKRLEAETALKMRQLEMQVGLAGTEP